MKIAIACPKPALTDALRGLVTAAEHTVRWTTADGGEAVRRCASDGPELLLLDADIGNPSCAEVTRQIMKRSPCPILLLTESVQGSLTAVYDALGHGALDVVSIGTLKRGGAPGEGRALLAKIAVAHKLSSPSSAETGRAGHGRPSRGPAGTRPRLVALGASTGGPQALADVLSALPRDLDAAVLIVQHVDQAFAGGLADWLESRSGIRTRLAVTGDRPTAGVALVAATNDHLVLDRAGTLRYTPEPRESPYRPSVDRLFGSLAEHWPVRSAAALLTGMGKDGARGLLRLREAGWHTVAQDESTSVIFGMPKAARDLNAAIRVLPINGIAGELARFLRTRQ